MIAALDFLAFGAVCMAALAVALYAACMAEAFAWRGLAALCKRKGKKARAEQFESYL